MEAEHTGEEAFSTSSFHRPYICPSTSPQQTRIIGHIINFTAAVWVWVLSELSEALCLSPELKGYMPWHRLTPRLRTAFYYRVPATFWRLPHTLLSGHNPQTQPNESKSAHGKSKGRSNTDCPTKTHTHTQRATQKHSSFLFILEVIPLSGSKVLTALLLFLLFVNSIQLLTPPNLSSVVEWRNNFKNENSVIIYQPKPKWCYFLCGIFENCWNK